MSSIDQTVYVVVSDITPHRATVVRIVARSEEAPYDAFLLRRGVSVPDIGERVWIAPSAQTITGRQ